MEANALCITVLDISSEEATIILNIKEYPLSRTWLRGYRIGYLTYDLGSSPNCIASERTYMISAHTGKGSPYLQNTDWQKWTFPA